MTEADKKARLLKAMNRYQDEIRADPIRNQRMLDLEKLRTNRGYGYAEGAKEIFKPWTDKVMADKMSLTEDSNTFAPWKDPSSYSNHNLATNPDSINSPEITPGKKPFVLDETMPESSAKAKGPGGFIHQKHSIVKEPDFRSNRQTLRFGPEEPPDIQEQKKSQPASQTTDQKKLPTEVYKKLGGIVAQIEKFNKKELKKYDIADIIQRHKQGESDNDILASFGVTQYDNPGGVATTPPEMLLEAIKNLVPDNYRTTPEEPQITQKDIPGIPHQSPSRWAQNNLLEAINAPSAAKQTMSPFAPIPGITPGAVSAAAGDVSFSRNLMNPKFFGEIPGKYNPPTNDGLPPSPLQPGSVEIPGLSEPLRRPIPGSVPIARVGYPWADDTLRMDTAKAWKMGSPRSSPFLSAEKMQPPSIAPQQRISPPIPEVMSIESLPPSIHPSLPKDLQLLLSGFLNK